MSSFNSFTKPKKDSGKTNYGNATPAEVIVGTKFSAASYINSTGALTLDGDSAVGDIINGKTFYKDDPKTKLTGTLVLDGDVSVGDVISGKTFYNTDPKTRLTGTGVLKKYATGTAVIYDGSGSYMISVTGLLFQPRVIICEYNYLGVKYSGRYYTNTLLSSFNTTIYQGTPNIMGNPTGFYPASDGFEHYTFPYAGMVGTSVTWIAFE